MTCLFFKEVEGVVLNIALSGKKKFIVAALGLAVAALSTRFPIGNGNGILQLTAFVVGSYLLAETSTDRARALQAIKQSLIYELKNFSFSPTNVMIEAMKKPADQMSDAFPATQ